MTPIPQITATPVELNNRMWALLAKERAGVITAPEQREVNLIFANMETDQENRK